MIANIITLPSSTSRHSSIIHEVITQKIAVRFHFGEVAQWTMENGICRAHKSVVRYHKYHYPNTPCWILEDDVAFCAPGAARYFLEHIPEDYDLFLGCISAGNVEEDQTTLSFSGLLCYIVHPRFFDTFLMLREDKNLDREMTTWDAGKITPKGKFVVCDPFVCISHNGYSHHHKQEVDYTKQFTGRNLYKG